MHKEKKDLNIFKETSLQFCITYVEHLGTEKTHTIQLAGYKELLVVGYMLDIWGFLRRLESEWQGLGFSCEIVTSIYPFPLSA